MTTRLFLSDLHLEDPASPAFLRLADYLPAWAAAFDEIYFLGDVVEMWIGDDDDGPMANALCDLLKSASEHAAIFVQHGNRDFLFKEGFAVRSGCTLLPDPTPLSDGTLVSHGDAYCTDDEDYQQFRALARSDAWQAGILQQSLAARRELGASLRAQSRETNANKASNIMDVNDAAVATAMDEHESQTLVHGHTHRPGMHVIEGRTRIVLGAWERCGWVCTQRDGQFRLWCFPLAHRCESEIPGLGR